MNRKIGVGVLWNLGGLIMSRGASMLFTLFLARFLAPEAFGLIAMVTICFELAAAFVESGLGQALIRSKSASRLDLSTVFFANLVLSGLAYAALYFAAPYVAAFYHQPALTLLVRVVGLVVFINAFKVVQTAVLSRAMNFRAQMLAGTVSMFVSGVLAVLLAYHGAAVWSLVAQILSAATVSTVILWSASNWRPAFCFSISSFRDLFRFGSSLLIEGLLSVLYQNSYVLVIGRFFSAELTGLYFFARKISNLVSQQLTSAIQTATLPALSTLQDENAELRRKYRQIIQLMMFIIAPVVLLLAALAPPLFDLLFDPRWKPAASYLQLLSIVALLYPLHALNMNILKVKGRSDLILKVGLVKKAVNLALLFAAIPYGVAAIILSQGIGSALALIPNTYFSARLIDYGLRDQALDAFKPLLVAIVASALAWGSTQLVALQVLFSLFLASAVGVIAYLGISYLVNAEGLVLLLRKVKRQAEWAL